MNDFHHANSVLFGAQKFCFQSDEPFVDRGPAGLNIHGANLDPRAGGKPRGLTRAAESAGHRAVGDFISTPLALFHGASSSK